MKRILLVALTVALALGLAATAYAGELQLSGKEAGAEAKYTNGALGDNRIWIKVGSLDFVDGSFKFHLTDAQLEWKPIGAGGQPITLNMGVGKWFAETGGDGIVFTLSNDKGRWVPYLGYMKPTVKMNQDAKFLVTGSGAVAGLNVNFNALESTAGVKDMNLSVSTTFDGVGVAGFVGGGAGTTYYGGDITLAGAIAGGTLNAGVFANTGGGLAYIAAVSGLQFGSFAVEANYKYGNANVMGALGTWADGNIPGANTSTFFAKASTVFDAFEMDHNFAVEFTQDIAASATTVKVSDGFNLSDAIQTVSLAYEYKSTGNDKFTASAKILPGVAGLEIHPAVEKEATVDLKFNADAKWALTDITLYGGLEYQAGLKKWYGLGISNATFGNLNTSLAGMFMKIGSTAYTRAYGAVSTDISETLTGVGLKALYAKEPGTRVIVIAEGNYAISADTNLYLGYLFREKGRLFAEIKKTIGSATFALSYGDSTGVDKDEATDDAIKTKWFDDANKYPWHTIQGSSNAGTANVVKASVVVKW